MAKNTYSSNIVAAYDTFAAWLDRTNQLGTDMYNYVVTTSNTAGPGLTSGNAFINGYFGANVVYVAGSLQGGTANTPGTLSIISNANISNTFSVGTSANVIITGTTITFANSTVNTTINATSYSGTAANAALLGGVSLSTLQSQITGNASAAYSNATAYAIDYANTSLANGSWVVANASYSSNTGAVGGVSVNMAGPTDGYVLAYDAGSSKIIFKNPSNISVALNANSIVANDISTNTLHVGTTTTNVVANSTTITAANSTQWANLSAAKLSMSNDGSIRLGASVSNVVINTSSFSIGNDTVNAAITSNSTVVSFSGTSNNAIYLGGTTLSTLQGQITGNAATAFSNAIANAASNAASIYQTMAGLSANVATLTANAAGYLGNSSGTISNISSWISGNSATAYSNAVAVASNASNITSGTVDPARLGSGTPDNTTILYGNGVWASAGALGVNTSAQFNWTNTHSFSANVTFVGNATSIVTVGNSTVNVAVNSTSISIGNSTVNASITSNSTVTAFSGTSNNALYLGGSTLATLQGQITGNAATAYTNATSYASNASNISTGTLSAARLPSTVVNTSAAFTISGVHTHNANLVLVGNTTSVITLGSSAANVTVNSTSATVSTNATVYSTITPTTITTATGSLGVGTAASGNQGEIRASNNITAYYTSDARLKQDVNPISDPLSKIMLITGVNFNWTDQFIADSGGVDGYFVRREDVGVIAQEIQSILPEAVAQRGDGFLAVRYEKIIPLLIEAIKELKVKVDTLEKNQ